MIKTVTAGIITATVAISTVLSVGFIVASPLHASAAGKDVVTERIELAFEEVSAATGDAVLSYRDAPAVDCDAAVWPHIDASCLSNAHEARSTPVRMIY